MNQKLQQAIAATRAGQKREAQLLLTQVLQEDEQDVHAWYLLSLLVESPQKQRAYLGKVLALDPDHEPAREHLNRLQTPVPAYDFEVESAEEVDEFEAAEAEVAPLQPSRSPEADFMAQERGDTLPDWLADDVDHLNLDQVEVEVAAMAEATPVDGRDDDVIPDWLQESAGDSWTDIEESRQAELEQVEEEEQPAMATAESEPLPAASAQTRAKPAKAQKAPATKARSGRDDRRRQEAWLTRLLIGLLVIAAVIFVLLVYIIVTTF